MNITLDIHKEGTGERICNIPLDSGNDFSCIPIRDEDRIFFQVILPHQYHNVLLYITDLSLTPSGPPVLIENGYRYRWHAHGEANQHKPFFRNILGECKLSLALQHHSSSQVELLPFCSIDIRGDKISQESVQKMVSYLGKHFPEAIWLSRSATALSTERTYGKVNDHNEFLNEIENGIKTLKHALPYIISKPCSRLSPKKHIQKTFLSPDYSSSNFDWLAEHPEVLLPVAAGTPCALQVGSQNYLPEALEVVCLEEDYDVYENQELLGYIELICEYLVAFINKYESHIDKDADRYQSGRGLYLYEILKIESLKFLTSSVAKAKRYLLTIRDLYNSYTSSLKISQPNKQPPMFTSKVLSNRHYRAIFEHIANWHTLGIPDWSIAKPRAGITSIDHVYELYCLCRLKNSITNSGFTEVNQEKEHAEISKLLFANKTHYLCLEYEKYFYSSRYAENNEFYNTERWSNSYGKFAKRKGTQKSHRCPDFTLSIWDKASSSPKKLIIFDAKYKDAPYAFINDLPACTLKYVHGISKKHGGQSPTSIFYLLCSGREKNSSQQNQYHFAENGFDLYGQHPAIPALGAVVVAPSAHWDFDRFIQRAIEVAMTAE